MARDHKEVGRAVIDKALLGASVKGVDIALQQRGRDGDRIEVLLSAQLTEGGTVLCVGQDITARVAREQDFVRLISTANAPIFGIDSAGRINIWNQQAEHVTGWASADALAKDLVKDFVPRASTSAYQEAHLRLL